MASIKVRGIVIAEAAMGDKDKRLTVLTAESGRITVMAKGAKSAKAKHAACAQLFCYSEFVLDLSHSFYYIREAEIIESFYDLRTNMDALSYASIMLEMSRVFALDGEDNTLLMHLLLRGLYRMLKTDTDYNLISLVFMMRLACEHGFLPELHACLQCGKAYEGEQGWAFSIPKGGLLCPACHKNTERILRSGSVSALTYIAEAPIDKVYLFRLEPTLIQEITPLIRQYVTNHAGIHLNSLDFVQSIENLLCNH